MMNKHSKIHYILLQFLFVSFLISCSSDNFTLREIYSDGEYDTQFPSKEASSLIEEIGKSVKLINSLVFYNRYHFSLETKITNKDRGNSGLLNRADHVMTFNKSASGTGTIVGENLNKLLFLTNAHVVFFEDTLVSYYSDDSGKVTPYIESISVKKSQSNYAGITGVGNLEIVHLDNKNDIALVGCEIINRLSGNYSLFNYKIGNSKELQWGDFVYALSYPMHYKMLTRGVVSIIENEYDYFMADLTINRGSSGGVVLALRDGIPNFELVGIISVVPADKKQVLVPEALMNNGRYQIDSKYKGNMIIGQVESVKYGIAKIISAEAIKNSISRGRDIILGKGYSLSSFAETD